MVMLTDFINDDILETAYTWLCKRRRDYPPEADCWRFRREWPAEKARLQAELLEGTYEIGLLSQVTRRDGKAVEIWSARDTVVLKALALVLAKRLPASSRCYHLAGHGGAKAAVRDAITYLPSHPFVLKTDGKAYDASIDHLRLLDRLATYISDTRILNLITQYLRRSVEGDGHYWSYSQGIALGCPLSPVLGAFFLYELDIALERAGFCALRFMDDVLVLTPTRWKLRWAVRLVNEALARLGLAKAPNKTYIGRITQGFSWLGYHLGSGRLRLARVTWERFAARIGRLYEQHADTERMGTYVQHWLRWVQAGLGTQVKLGTPRSKDHLGCDECLLTSIPRREKRPS
jgi:RNA-directed DNA polymerase